MGLGQLLLQLAAVEVGERSQRERERGGGREGRGREGKEGRNEWANERTANGPTNRMNERKNV